MGKRGEPPLLSQSARRAAGRASRDEGGENDGGVGSLCLGMGFDPAALAARDRGHRLDRRLVLLHASRRRLAQNAEHEDRRRRRLVAGARRRLLRDEQIYARPGGAARSPRLAQVAVLLDLDLRLQPAVLGLLRPIERLPDRSDGDAAQPVAGGGDRRRRRWRSAGSSTTCCASRRSPSTTRCWRWSASATSC